MKEPYYEKMFSWWVLIVLAVVFILIFTPKEGEPSWVIYYFIPIFSAGFLFLFLNFLYLSIKLTDKHLIFGYGLFKQKIPLEKIKSCKPCKYSFRTYWGYGIRFGFDKSIAYSYRSGPSIRIETKNKRVFVVNSNNPEYICRIIKA